MTKVFQIYVDDEETNCFYNPETEKQFLMALKPKPGTILINRREVNKMCKSNRAEIVFEAIGTFDDLHDLYDNLDNEYPEFINDFTKEKLEVKNNDDDKMNKYFKCHFYGIWLGDTDDLIRLTHHAEGLYNNTQMEHVHVEVYLNGKWYGRK